MFAEEFATKGLAEAAHRRVAVVWIKHDPLARRIFEQEGHGTYRVSGT